MSIRTRLIDAIYGVATGSRRVRLLLAPLGGLGFFTVITLLVLLFLGIGKWLHLPAFPPWPWNLVIAAPLLTLGIGLAVWHRRPIPVEDQRLESLVETTVRPGHTPIVSAPTARR